jgi:hypothetical protein
MCTISNGAEVFSKDHPLITSMENNNVAGVTGSDGQVRAVVLFKFPEPVEPNFVNYTGKGSMQLFEAELAGVGAPPPHKSQPGQPCITLVLQFFVKYKDQDKETPSKIKAALAIGKVGVQNCGATHPANGQPPASQPQPQYQHGANFAVPLPGMSGQNQPPQCTSTGLLDSVSSSRPISQPMQLHRPFSRSSSKLPILAKLNSHSTSTTNSQSI